jgi:hypothetical protein
MNGQNHMASTQSIPSELNEIILNILRTSPGLPSSTIQLLLKTASMAFTAGINTGMYTAIDRIEQTNTKLQALVN